MVAKRRRKTQTETLSSQMKERSSRKIKREKRDEYRLGMLSTGSTMLNLAISDSVDGGWPLGKINTLPGGSTAGKSILCLHTLCEAAINPKFDDYQLIHDDAEMRNDFNIAKMFPPLVDRLMTPTGVLYKDLKDVDPDEIGISHTIQELQARMLMKLKRKEKFIWIVDSLDAITTDEEIAKEVERAGNLEKGKENKTGTYSMEKAKFIHRILRTVESGISQNECLLILTQQLRQRINPSFGQKHWYTNGGEGPYFFSHARPFMKTGSAIKELGRIIGRETKIEMDKNSVTGKIRDVSFNIYYDLGIDDIGSMVEFLLKEKHWKPGAWIEAPELGLRENGRDKLIRSIEEQGLERKLKRTVQKVWNGIEKKLELNRKPRY